MSFDIGKLPPEFLRLRDALPSELEVYLVGGAVRDLLLGLPIHDMDFVMSGGDVLAVSRQLAAELGFAFFPLDAERQVARLIAIRPDGSRLDMDFALLRGSSLKDDLGSRDFTINALAMSLHDPAKMFDPLGGAVDLLEKRLKPCSPSSFVDDPVRVLRGIRFVTAHAFKIDPEISQMMRQAVDLLPRVSPERLRDELFSILSGSRAALALRLMEKFGVLPHLLPELPSLKGVEQPPPHLLDVWEHTLDLLNELDALQSVLHTDYNPDDSANLMLGLAVLRLGRYRNQLTSHLSEQLSVERTVRSLVYFAALYHDVGKPQARQLDESGKVRFLGHDEIGAQLIRERGVALRLSNVEINRMVLMVRHHMRPILLAKQTTSLTPRAIYRYFRDLGAAGVDVCLLSLADTLATYRHTISQEIWMRQLDVVRQLLEAWWERPQEQVSPPALISGKDLLEHLRLPPGALIGRLLEAVREAQVTGEVTTREQALDWAKLKLEQLDDQG